MLPDLITGPGTTLAGVQVIGHELLSREKNEENKKFDSWQLCFKLIGPGSWLAPLRTTGRTPMADFHFSIAPSPPCRSVCFIRKCFAWSRLVFFCWRTNQLDYRCAHSCGNHSCSEELCGSRRNRHLWTASWTTVQPWHLPSFRSIKNMWLWCFKATTHFS